MIALGRNEKRRVKKPPSSGCGELTAAPAKATDSAAIVSQPNKAHVREIVAKTKGLHATHVLRSRARMSRMMVPFHE